MATLKSLKTQIENANATGVENLTKKGVDISADATTFDIMTAIADVVGGGGANYTSVVYNEDNTITLTEENGTIHTMECEFSTDGRVTSLKYDEKVVELTYEDRWTSEGTLIESDVLVKVGETDVDIINAFKWGTGTLPISVTFIDDDGKLYEHVSIRVGNWVNMPTVPTKVGYNFLGWKSTITGDIVTFPYTPDRSDTLLTTFSRSYEKMLYDHFGVDKSECPYIVVRYRESACTIYFCTHIYSDKCIPKYQVPYSSIDTTNIFVDLNDYDTIFGGICSLFSPDLLEPYTANTSFFYHSYYYLNNPDIVPDESAGTYYFE
jgi:hypothetical protein